MDLQEVGWGALTRLIWLIIETGQSFCEHSIEHVGYGLYQSKHNRKM